MKFRKRRKNPLEKLLRPDVLEMLEQMRAQSRKQMDPHFENIKKYAEEWNQQTIRAIYQTVCRRGKR